MVLKLKRTPGLYIVGFMGCGKSTVGRTVAKQLGWRFSDLDEEIESAQKRTIAEIFDAEGEAGFRKIESEALRRRVHEIACGMPWVVAVGGGCFTEPENFDLMRNHGLTIWLDCPFEMIRSRVAHATHRPLARDPQKFEELYHERLPFYQRADVRVIVSHEGSPGAAEAILKLPYF